ncbi:hypothetical protein PSNVIR_01140 [Pseudomonas sp. Nvir]|nr:hypothetical protein PSNVIR_01140 [Pseudomonas sp. Nvir]
MAMRFVYWMPQIKRFCIQKLRGHARSYRFCAEPCGSGRAREQVENQTSR